ncbi:MAG: UDP-N-acetylglucosamine--LPS N-acetylglucosamine transferase [Mycobacteriales bacterium]
MPERPDSERHLLLVCSPGGHLLQMLRLEPAWGSMLCSWVSLEAADSRSLLRGQSVTFATGPTNRSLRATLANLRLAWRLVRDQRPAAILSTGAALAVPFFIVGKLHGCRLVYVESVTRIESLSLSGKIVYPLADAFFVQWPKAAGRRRRARFVGGLL